MSEDDTPCYVSFRDPCGCTTGACVNDGKHNDIVAEFLSEHAGAGLRIETRSVDWVRENLTLCRKLDNCPKRKPDAPMPLFDPPPTDKE